MKEIEVVDKIFAVLYLLVGYLFIYVFTAAHNTWDLSAFTLFYALIVLMYLWAKDVRPPKESWFWLGVLLAVGIPFAFWSVLYVFQIMALIGAAAYWTLSASGRLLQNGKTSQWVFFDGWNAFAAVPFGNFGSQICVLLNKNQEEEKKKEGHPMLSVLLGIALTIPVLIIILPLLSNADAGFERMVGKAADYIREHLLTVLLRGVFAVPVSFYLYGLIFGGISGRKTDTVQTEKLTAAGQQVKRVPYMAACTALMVICLTYLLFIGIQGNYLFASFAGKLPQNFTYAEYARRGFFELCQIGMWNLLILGGVQLFAHEGDQNGKLLEYLKSLLDTLTLLLILTAVSKLGMYIRVYGLTVNRVIPMVFLIWMALVFVAFFIHQKMHVPTARFCIMAGAVLFCTLCVFPVESWVAGYNEWARLCGYIL